MDVVRATLLFEGVSLMGLGGKAERSASVRFFEHNLTNNDMINTSYA